MIRRPPRSTLSSSSAASDVYKRQAYEGMCCGLSLCLIPALIALSFTGSGPALSPTHGAPDSLTEYISVLFGTEGSGAGFVQALCVTSAGAVMMHASRHGRALASWALMVLAIAACLATCLCATHAIVDSGLAHAWAPALISGLVLIAMISAPLWASKVAGLEPTTCLLYTSPSPRDQRGSRMPSSA